MTKEFKFTQGNNNISKYIIQKGQSIYDDWKKQNLSSKRIVSRVENAVSLESKKATISASKEAFAYLYALDLHIKEKYSNIFQRIFSYFSWRREMRTLKKLKSFLHIPNNHTDIRTMIEVFLQKFNENIEFEEDDDDKTRGGKRNTKSEDEMSASDENQLEQEEDTVEEIPDIEDAEKVSEENADEPSEEIPVDELQKENTQESTEQTIEQQSLTVEPQDKSEITIDQSVKVEIKLEDKNQLNKENNGADEAEEPIKNKTEKTYNDAIDIAPPHEETKRNKPVEEKSSSIDEFLWDDMVKANHSDMEDNLSVDLKENIDNSKISQGEQKEDTNKDAHLYDKIIRDQKNEPINTKIDASTTSQPTQQALKQTAIPTVSSDMLNINTISESKPDEKMRVPIMVDITTDTENDIRKYISNNFSDESMENIHEMQEAEMRQLLMLACEEFGVDPPNMPVEGPEPPKVNAPNIIANRK